MSRAPHLTLWLLGAAALAALIAPLVGLVSRASLGDAIALLMQQESRVALALSLRVSAAAVIASLTLGLPLAWVLARAEFPGKRVVRTLVALPLVLPPVVAGIALLAAFGRYGLLGATLDAFGVRLPFTTLAAVAAATFVAAPLLVITLEAALAQADPRYEEVAAALGASRWRRFVTVLLPSIRPGLLAALALCWARALGEFGATITFAGNLQGVTRTAPLAIYQLLQTEPDQAYVLGVVLMLLSLAVLSSFSGRGARP